MNKINVLGLGPGHQDYILPITKKTIEKSHVVVGGKRNLESLKLNGKKTYEIKTPLIDSIEFIKKNKNDKIVSVVVSGDSGFYSLTTYLKRHFKRYELNIVPGISSLQYLFAKITIPWQHASLISMHGRQDDPLETVKQNKQVGILTDQIWTPNKIADFLIKNNIKKRKIYVGENLSYKNEKIHEFTLEECSKNIFEKLNVMVVSDE